MQPGKERKSEDKEKLLDQIQQFPAAARDFVTYLSSLFLEEDIYERHRNNPQAIREIAGVLRGQGVSEDGVLTVLTYFDFRQESVKRAMGNNNGPAAK